MQVDKTPFPAHTNVHTLELNNPKVLLRPTQAEGAKGKNVIIGDPRPNNVKDKVPVREVVLEKSADGKESLKITINAPRLRGQGSPTSGTSRPAVQVQPVRPVSPTGQTGQSGQTGPAERSDRSRIQPRTFKLRRPEVGTWKINKPKIQGRSAN